MAASHHYSHSSGSTDSASSAGSAASSGSAYQMILDHILAYPGSYEMPLRTMYTLNCGPRATRSGTPTPASSTGHSPTVSQGGGFPDAQTTQTFTDNLMAQLAQMPHQPTSLPPGFITSFVQRLFPATLAQVDFPQALTGLDYLKDLETRRRREVAAAFQRLRIDRRSLDRDAAELAVRYPAVLQWIRAVEEKERKIDSLYTQLYIGLRRWILINELSLQPFNKHNCVAMLNTLYPPVMPTQPTQKLTTAVLKTQRDGFFQYIRSVEHNGRRVLGNLINQGKLPADINGWPAVVRTLTLYLQLANSMISECMEIAVPEDLTPPKRREPPPSRHVRKADSGVSFTSTTDARPPTRCSIDEPSSPVESLRPRTPMSIRSGGSALEKLARGLKGIGRSRTDVTEMISHDDHHSTITSPTSPTATFPIPAIEREKPRLLRKMRSLGSLDAHAQPKSSVPARQYSVSQSPTTVSADAVRRQQQKYQVVHQKFGFRSYHGHDA